MEIVPSIDLREGQVVRLQQGDFARQTAYPVDPCDVARSFAAAGASLMHLVDLEGAKAGHVAQPALIARVIAAAGIPVQVGGGVRTTADVKALLDAGAARVVVGTAALDAPDWFRATALAYPGKLVLAVDAKDGVIATRGWTETAKRTATQVARDVSTWGAAQIAAILYTDIAVDGMLTGPNYNRTAELVKSFHNKIPILASGGVGTLEHLTRLKKTHCWGVIVGRALYEGKLTLADALKASR